MGFGLDAAALNRRKQALERAQQAVNQAVLELCGPYMPRDTGALIRSGGVQGKAAVGWSSPYAAAQYQATAGGPGTRVRRAG